MIGKRLKSGSKETVWGKMGQKIWQKGLYFFQLEYFPVKAEDFSCSGGFRKVESRGLAGAIGNPFGLA